MTSNLLAGARKIVCKFGSSTLAAANGSPSNGGPENGGSLDTAFFAEFAAQAATLIAEGKQLALVSSGAQAAGLAVMAKWQRQRDIHYRQALCAVGQVELMEAWKRAFGAHGLHVAQILLTRDDFGDPIRSLNMRNTLFTLVDEGVIPVINENDTVSVEEIKIGDNDTLAAQSAVLWSADLLVLFSDIDGLYTSNPHTNPGAAFIETVPSVAAIRPTLDTAGKGSLGTGGIATKLDAAEKALSYGIPVLLTRGKPAALSALLAGTQRGTVFTGM